MGLAHVLRASDDPLRVVHGGADRAAEPRALGDAGRPPGRMVSASSLRVLAGDESGQARAESPLASPIYHFSAVEETGGGLQETSNVEFEQKFLATLTYD